MHETLQYLHPHGLITLVSRCPYPLAAVGSILLSVIGALYCLSWVLAVAHAVYKYFLRPGRDLRMLGNWAVVTGCTDGIGRAYCGALAKQGINILLISRSDEKLAVCAAELQRKFKVQTKTVAVDFANASAEAWSTIRGSVAGLDIGVLVNSVGLSYDHAEYFEAVDEKTIADLITVNVTVTTKMCHMVLPGMKARRRGAIVNLGSAASTVWPAWPLYAVYAATKSYVDMLSRSLDLESRQQGVRVQCQAPLYVATKMTRIRKPRLDAPSPDQWVASAVKHIGYEQTSCPYWVHALMWGVISLWPVWYTNQFITNHSKALRAKYMKKLERQSKTE